MPRAVKVRGRLSDPRHIELDQPVHDLRGPVDVVVQSVQQEVSPTTTQGLIGMCADLGQAPSAEEMDDARREMSAELPRGDFQ
jgi:hypothetical protein